MTILAGPLKRTIIARIASLDLADPDDLGDTVQVVSAIPPNPDRKCVFGGRTTWSQREALAERNIAFEQVVTFEVRVRVAIPGAEPDDCDREAERIVSIITAGVAANPDLTGGRGRIVATSGDADPIVAMPDPDPMVIVNVGIVFTATLSVVGA